MKKVEKLLKNVKNTPTLKTIVAVEPVILEMTLMAEEKDIEIISMDDIMVSHDVILEMTLMAEEKDIEIISMDDIMVSHDVILEMTLISKRKTSMDVKSDQCKISRQLAHCISGMFPRISELVSTVIANVIFRGFETGIPELFQGSSCWSWWSRNQTGLGLGCPRPSWSRSR